MRCALKAAILATALVSLPLPAWADETQDTAIGGGLNGRYLADKIKGYEECEAAWAVKRTCSAEAVGDHQFFFGFVAGAQDAGNWVGKAPPWCHRDHTQYAQISSIVANYLKAHPEQWDLGAGRLVVMALKGAYPCPATRR